jgi:hypothetical protein
MGPLRRRHELANKWGLRRTNRSHLVTVADSTGIDVPRAPNNSNGLHIATELEGDLSLMRERGRGTPKLEFLQLTVTKVAREDYLHED